MKHPDHPDHPLSRRIADVLSLQPDAPAIEYEGKWLSWRQVSDLSRRIGALTRPGAQVGMLLRNRPPHVAALLGVLGRGGCAVTINPSRGDDRIRADLSALRLPLIVGEPDDLAQLVAPSAGTTVVSISDLQTEPLVSPDERAVANDRRPGVAVRMLTSGTTGPPKRIDLTYDMLARSVMGTEPEQSSPPSQCRHGINHTAIVNSPLVHIGGVFRVLQCVVEARSFVLLERFDLDRWADAVRRHQPRTVSLVPAALRMVLHSDLTRDNWRAFAR